MLILIFILKLYLYIYLVIYLIISLLEKYLIKLEILEIWFICMLNIINNIILINKINKKAWFIY